MKYVKKPVVVDAVQWFSHGDHPAVKEYLSLRPDNVVTGWLNTELGGYVVVPGDWVVTDERGKTFSCSPEVFAQTYEATA